MNTLRRVICKAAQQSLHMRIHALLTEGNESKRALERARMGFVCHGAAPMRVGMHAGKGNKTTRLWEGGAHASGGGDHQQVP